MTNPFKDTALAAFALHERYRKGAAFRGYLRRHAREVLAATLVLTCVALACTAATIVFVGGTSAWRVFLALLLAPLVLGANLGMLLFVYFAWLETRAVPAPRFDVPWLPLATLVGVPFLMLAWLAWPAAVAAALLVGGLPWVHLRLEQPATAAKA